jgi:predicted transcriptional regulator
MNGYFNGSFKNLVSFFVKENDLNIQDFEELMKEINKKNK